MTKGVAEVLESAAYHGLAAEVAKKADRADPKRAWLMSWLVVPKVMGCCNPRSTQSISISSFQKGAPVSCGHLSS